MKREEYTVVAKPNCSLSKQGRIYAVLAVTMAALAPVIWLCNDAALAIVLYVAFAYVSKLDRLVLTVVI